MVLPVAVPIALGVASIAAKYLGGRKDAAAQRDLIDKNRKNALKKLQTPQINRAGRELYGGQWGAMNPAVMDQIMQWFTNPGQTNTIQYERAQEQGEVMNRAAQQALGGAFAGSGWAGGQGGAPQGLYGSLIAATLMGLAKQRNEALRNQAQLEEGLKRQDQAAAMQSAMAVMQQILGLQGQKANINAGSPIGPASPSGATGLGNALGMLSNIFGGMSGGAPATTAAQNAAQNGSNAVAMSQGIF